MGSFAEIEHLWPPGLGLFQISSILMGDHLIVPLPQRFSVLSPPILCIPESLATLHPLPVSVVDCLPESQSHLPPVGVVGA